VRNERGVRQPVAPLPLAARFCAARSFLWPAIVSVLLALLISTDSLAATIERYSFRRIDNAAEVEFQMRGTPAKWRLHNHGQELWLDLEHSQVSAAVEPVSVPVIFPLIRVNIRDFGSGRVRLVIRVRGEVDYVVAQMPRVLVVRIAPSGQAVDLAEPLLREMEQSRHSSESVAAPTPKLGAPGRGWSPTIVENGHRPAEAEMANQPSVAESPISSSGGALSPNALPGAPLVPSSEPGYGAETTAQTVQPVAQHIRPAPWVGQDRAPPIVVIDAGHGGFDPGTESAGGVAEKTVALAIARRLAAALESRGVTTELTRNDDRFLSLGGRTQLANHAHADLFVSIHLNSSPDWNTSGIETYYLNNTTDRATIRLARMENGGDYSAVGESNLNYILTNLQQDYKANESSSLARMIEAQVVTSVEATLGIRINALGAKMGPFYVLVGAEMPSVLIECGFLSNPREAQLLIQPNYQDAIADGIAVAIMHYFNADAAVGNL
jgi:N-acetylmuramoyl-L-alanine amidase